MNKTILFLCTGNYYRSRFAESLFNHMAAEKKLELVAISRGLQIDMATLVGTVSVHTRDAARARGVKLDTRMPIDLTYGDLRNAHLVVAVKETEHRPRLDARFPGWSHRVVFWNVHDLDGALPELALVEIETQVKKLIAQLAAM